MMRLRLVDATVTECVLWPRQALGRDLLEALQDCTPIPDAEHAVPVLPAGAYGKDLLHGLVATAPVLEPLTWSARREIVATPSRAHAVLVDPQGVPLGAAYPAATVPDGWTRECVAWIPPGPLDPAALDRALAALPPGARLRLHDPHGILDPDTVRPLCDHPDASRFTLALENARGLALATARSALERPEGPQIRTSLLGIGRRTGLPATELLHPEHADALRPLAERAALVAGHPVPPEHPLWGIRRHEVAEAERMGGAPLDTVRWNPATLPHLLQAQLEAFGIATDEETLDRLTTALSARLRPGERADGPTLYAFLATHIDLARATGGSKGSP